jgi:hypothetical protein
MTNDFGDGYRFEMALTRAEFLRLLPFAVGQPKLRVEGESIAGRTRDVEWMIRIVEQPERRIAGLALPTLDVTLECAAGDRDGVQRFIDRFMRAYQRAGG